MLKHIMNGGSLRSLMLRQSENENGSETDIEDFQYDLDALKEGFKDDRGRDLKVSNKHLQLAIENNDQFDDWTAEEDSKAIFDFFEKVEEATKRVAISDPGITALAEKLNSDDMFGLELTECVDAVMKNKTTAVDMYAQLHRVLSKEELDSMPMVGTEEKDVSGTNYRPDKIKTKDRVTGVEMTVTWSNDFCSSLAHVKAWETELDDVTKELKTSGTVARYKNTSRAELLALKSTLTAKRNGVRSMMKRAINTHHQFEAVAAMPLVVIEWIPGSKKDGIRIPSQFGAGFADKTDFYVSKAPKPLWIYPKGQASKGKEFSITQLVNFDVPMAMKGDGGGTMGDLIDTLSKGADTTEDKSGDGSKMEIEEAIGTAQRFANFLDVKDNLANYRRVLADKKREDRQELLETLEAMYHALLPLHRAYAPELEAMKEKAAQKAEQIAAAKKSA